MKIFKSTNETPIDSLLKGKVMLTANGEGPESIWVAKDLEKNKMYLLNNALNFYPMPSWGTELDLADSLDIADARGETFDDTVVTMHPEAYEFMLPFMIGDELNLEKFFSVDEEVSEEGLE